MSDLRATSHAVSRLVAYQKPHVVRLPDLHFLDKSNPDRTTELPIVAKRVQRGWKLTDHSGPGSRAFRLNGKARQRAHGRVKLVSPEGETAMTIEPTTSEHEVLVQGLRQELRVHVLGLQDDGKITAELLTADKIVGSYSARNQLEGELFLDDGLPLVVACALSVDLLDFLTNVGSKDAWRNEFIDGLLP